MPLTLQLQDVMHLVLVYVSMDAILDVPVVPLAHHVPDVLGVLDAVVVTVDAGVAEDATEAVMGVVVVDLVAMDVPDAALNVLHAGIHVADAKDAMVLVITAVVLRLWGNEYAI